MALAASSITLSARAFAQAPPAAVTPLTDAPPAPPPPPVPPAPPPAHGPLEFSTLGELHEHGVLSDAEYERALHDIGESTGAGHAQDAGSLVLGKWATTIYGFVEGDTIYDSTQSFTDLAGNGQVLRPTGQTAAPAATIPSQPSGGVQPITATQGYEGSHGQLLMSVRNSRLGLRLRAPGTESVHVNGMVEMDFLGNQPSGTSQSSFFTSPTMRLRHAMFRVDTPVVDFMVGQYWHLFGFMEGYLPNTTEIQGVPGELYARAPQVRISKTIHAGSSRLEIAVAAVRPPSGSELPEGEAGIRYSLESWRGMHTAGATGTSLVPLSIAVSGDYRAFEVPEVAALLPTAMVHKAAASVAGDLFIPILPARPEKRDNALSLLGQAVYGNGIADLYSNMQTGIYFPFIPNTTGLQAYEAWPTNIDNGLVTYDLTNFALHPVQWTSLLGGLEYYLPGLGGKVWISGNFSHVVSSNSSQFARLNSSQPDPTVYFFPANQSQVRHGEDWWDANVFFDPITSVRVGLEFATFYDHYVDGFTAQNHRAQASGFFIF
jgi:hypothetical protein